jgi:two-component system phosphate regulon sensor histidine kinase PhoR
MPGARKTRKALPRPGSLADLRRQALQLRKELASRKKDHERLFARFQAQQHALFNSMVEGVLVLDRRGHILLINQSLQRLFNLRADVRGQTILEAFRLADLADLVQQVRKKRMVQNFALELPGMDDERWIEVNAAAVLDRGNTPGGAILVFHDVTRIRQLERTRQEFVANVSHELRTPLSLIKGFVETLIDGAEKNPASRQRYLQTIEKQTDRLAFLIEDLLTISRLESGQVVLNLQPVDLHDETQRVAEDLRERAREKKITVVNQVPSGLTARADADRLQQVLFNLIENAIKYGSPGGSVTISGKPAAGKVEISVRDDGPGIPPEARERVFERFYRVDRARSREKGGTGLGLSIVKHIVQAHGGEVWLKSELGEGTVFYITLPKE